jgi:peptidoglycan/xylan/chitin deacetylase (PgdA/CDA1 family)
MARHTVQIAVVICFAILIGILIDTLFYSANEAKKLKDLEQKAYYDQSLHVKPRDIKVSTTSAELRIPIVMYHYVEYVRDPADTGKRSLAIRPDTFEGHLQSLQDNNYKTYFVKEIPNLLSGKIKYDPHIVVLTFDDGYEDFYFNVLPLLQKYKMKATLYIINDYVGRNGFLNQDEIKEIIKSGLVEIGAHTLDHRYLTALTSEKIKQQIFESKSRLESDYGIKVESFAYPFGAFNNSALEFTKQASFSAAVSVIPGTDQSYQNLFYMYRIRAGAFGKTNMVKVLENYKVKP